MLAFNSCKRIHIYVSIYTVFFPINTNIYVSIFAIFFPIKYIDCVAPAILLLIKIVSQCSKRNKNITVNVLYLFECETCNSIRLFMNIKDNKP